MKVRTRYIVEGCGMYSVWVDIEGQRDTEYNVYFNEYKPPLVDGRIAFSKISSEENLVESGVEYLKKWNEENLINQLIPIGLLDYSYDYGPSRLKIYNIPDEEIYKVPMIIEGVIEAIRIKKQGVEMHKRFNERYVDEIEL